jgi:hypothetical protein
MKAWLCLVSTLISLVHGYNQEVLNPQRAAGTLRRFNVTDELKKSVIALAQVRLDLDP